MRGIFIKDRGMVKLIHNLLLYNTLQIPKIYDHSQFYVAGIGNRPSNYGYRKFVTVAMYISTFTIITEQGMSGFKIELFGNTNIAHIIYLDCKGKLFCETNRLEGAGSMQIHI